MYRYFQRQTSEKTRTWLRKGNLKKETEYLLMAAQNNAIRTNYVEEKIDKTQQKSKYRLCSDHHIISDCSKLKQKEYKNRHNWVGKVIHWELKFDQTNKLYMHHPERALKNGIHKRSLGYCDTNGSPNLSQMTRPRDNLQKKKKKRTCRIVDLAVLAGHRVKLKKSTKRDKYLDLARELKKQWNMKVTVIPIVIGTLGTVTKELVQGPKNLLIRGQVETIQITALLRSARIRSKVLETWGDLLSLKLRTHQLTLVRKISKEYNNNDNNKSWPVAKLSTLLSRLTTE